MRKLVSVTNTYKYTFAGIEEYLFYQYIIAKYARRDLECMKIMCKIYVFCFFFSDINECDGSNGDCDQKCVNFPGGHTCDCNQGYKFGDDGNKCIGTITFENRLKH